jgi:hypothetical protein
VDDWANTGMFDSIWEQAFARRVLASLPDVSADDVEPQAYVSASGETYKVDFFIPRASLVLEVDGYAKDGTPPTPTDVERRNRRDANLQAQGMTVLHFSNAQVQHEPSQCRQQVAAILVSRRASPVEAAPPASLPPMPPAAAVVASQPTPKSSLEPAPSIAKSRSGGLGLWVGLGLAAIAIAAVVGFAVAASSSSSTGTVTPTVVETEAPGSRLPVDGKCQAPFPFKGNINDQQERIVHAPGQRYYDKTRAEMCYASISAAAIDGYRPSRQ